MTPETWDRAIAGVERLLGEGEGYTLDIVFSTGGVMTDVAPWMRDGLMVRLDRPGHAPTFAAIDHIVTIKQNETVPAR